MQETCREEYQHLYAAFYNLTKAFDTNRPALWSLLSKLGCPAKFMSIVQQCHDGMCVSVSANGRLSSPSDFTCPVCGRICVAHIGLFSHMITHILANTYCFCQ